MLGGKVGFGRGRGKGLLRGSIGSRGVGHLGGGRGASSSASHGFHNPVDVDADDEEDDVPSETQSQVIAYTWSMLLFLCMKCMVAIWK